MKGERGDRLRGVDYTKCEVCRRGAIHQAHAEVRGPPNIAMKCSLSASEYGL